MAVRRPASNPSSLPPSGATPAPAGTAGSVRPPASAVVGFLVGAVSLAFPFVYFRSVLTSGLGLWVALFCASCVLAVMLAVGLPLTVAGRPGSRSRSFGAGLVLVLAVLGQLSAWGLGYLWLLS